MVYSYHVNVSKLSTSRASTTDQQLIGQPLKTNLIHPTYAVPYTIPDEQERAQRQENNTNTFTYIHTLLNIKDKGQPI